MNQKTNTGLPSITWRKVARLSAIALVSIFRAVVFDVLIPVIVWVGRAIATGLRRSWKRYRRWWRVTQRAYRFYIVGQIVFLLGMFVQALVKGAVWPMAILFIGAVMFFFGFVSWAQPVLHKAIDSPAGKWAYRIAHALFAIIAIVAARAVVFDALKLPPQYFDLTVAMVALITYVPVWLGAIAMSLAVMVAGMYVSWAIGQIAQFLGNSLIVPFFGRPLWFTRAQRKLEIRSNKRYFHTIGLFAALFFIASLFDGFGYVTRHSLSGIRWFAYFADFQAAGNYPGVSCEGRIRLMDNGIVALARIVDYDININRQNFKTEQILSRGCLVDASSRKFP